MPPPASLPPLARIVVRGTVWTTLGNNVNQVIGFAAILILTRALTPEIFGYFALAGFWVSLLNLRAKLGLSYAAIRQAEVTGDLLGTYWLLDSLAVGGSLALCAGAAAVFRALGMAPEISLAILVLAAAEAQTTIVAPLSMALEKELQLSRLTLNTLLTSTCAYAVAIGLAVSGAGLISLLIINVISGALASLGVAWVASRRLPGLFRLRWRFDAGLARRLIRHGLPTGLSLTAVSNLSTQYDNFLVGTLVGPAALGFYDRAYRIAQWPTVLVTSVVNRVGFLTFAKVKDDPLRLQQAVRLSLWVLLMGAVPLTLLLAWAAPDVVAVLYDARWAPSAPWLRGLAALSLLIPITGTAFWLSVALGDSRATFWLTGLQMGVLILAATPLTLWAGVPGTLAGVAAGYGAASLVGCAYIFRRVRLSARETFGPPALAAAAALGGLSLAAQWPAWPGLAPAGRLLLSMAVLGGCFFPTAFALQWRETLNRLKYFREIWRAA